MPYEINNKALRNINKLGNLVFVEAPDGQHESDDE